MLTLAACILSGATAVVFAAMMVLQRSLYASAICLLVVLLQASVLFYFSGSPLLAFLQIMVYAGAVMVLVIVTIMSSPEPAERRWSGLSFPRWLAALGLLMPLVEAGMMMSRSGGGGLAHGASAQGAIGPVLFGPFSVATEAVGLLLFLAALAVADSRSVR